MERSDDLLVISRPLRNIFQRAVCKSNFTLFFDKPLNNSHSSLEVIYASSGIRLVCNSSNHNLYHFTLQSLCFCVAISIILFYDNSAIGEIMGKVGEATR